MPFTFVPKPEGKPTHSPGKSARNTSALALAIHIACTGLAASTAVTLPMLLSSHANAQSNVESQAHIAFDIPAGSLSAALNRFAEQTGLYLSGAGELTNNKTSSGLKGEFTVAEGLQQLLAGSGITYRLSGENTVTLMEGSDRVTALPPVQVSAQLLGATTENTGSYTTGQVTLGKGGESIREIPQSVSVVTQQRLRDQNISTLPEAMKFVTGITVQKFDGANYFNTFNARGYAADTFQIDGVNVQVNANMADTDLVVFDRVEILRGAAGLFQGSGEPGVTINLVRKRAMAENSIQGLISAGSWDNYRAELDLTGGISADNRLRGRFIAALDDRGSFLDGVYSDKQLVYTTVEYDLTPATTFATGVTWQKIDSIIDQGLPVYADGSLPNVSRSTAIVADWNGLDMETLDYFAELEHTLQNGGTANLIARRIERERTYAGMRANGYIQADGGIATANVFFPTELEDTSIDLFLKMPFMAFGQEHNLTLGADYRTSDNVSKWGSAFYDPGTGTTNIFERDVHSPAPALIRSDASPSRTETDQQGIYARFKYRATDRVSVLLGARSTWWDSKRVQVNTGEVSSEYDAKGELTSYTALMYDLNQSLSLYLSYADIFKPQNALTRGGDQIEPRSGEQVELGIKGEWLDGRVNAHAAVFQLEDSNRALPDPVDDQFSISAGKVRSRGFEAEVSGELWDGWQLTAGYAYNDMKYLRGTDTEDGQDFSEFTPEHNINLWTKYRFDSGAVHGAEVGGGLRRVSDFYAGTGEGRTVGEGYTTVSLFASYPINERLTAAVNIDNLFDKKYYEKVDNWYRQSFYGAPRSITVTLRAMF